MFKEVMYYLFINGQPKYYYESEEEAMDYIHEYCWEKGISIEELDYEIKPFTEFNTEFPDPYDEYEF